MAPMTSVPAKLPLPQVVAYGSVGIPFGAVGLPMAVFIAPFYAEQMGLGTALVGLIFMVLRFWDLFSDPVMGWLVDTKPSRLGKIRHWLLIAVPILLPAVWFLYNPVGPPVSPLFLAVILFIFYIGTTMIVTPHQAWAPSIAKTYDERSRLFMWRELFTISTMLVMLALPSLLEQFGGISFAEQISIMGWFLIIALPVTVGAAVWLVPDPKPDASAPRASFHPKAILAALKQQTLWRLLATEIFIGIAIAGTAGTFLFASLWGFGVGHGTASLILMAHFIAGFAAMPVWVWISKRTEKYIAMRSVCLWSALTYVCYMPLALMGGGAVSLLIAAIVSGFGYGSPFILVRSMMADLVEAEEARGGGNRAGLFYSLMSGAYKTGASFAIGIPYILLGVLVGFNPATDNSPETVRGLMLVFVGVPVVSYALAALLIWRYPITRADQEKAAEAINAGGQANLESLHPPVNKGDAP
ncbi:MFS transporter [Henriciella mobilis]|uniref:MFS transporter n=2 Tax=Henriciella mobilis TaxID=2305467 RepID=A0A399R5M8_9PROT|nr:MFS transporter [Henriciella mobilis]